MHADSTLNLGNWQGARDMGGRSQSLILRTDMTGSQHRRNANLWRRMTPSEHGGKRVICLHLAYVKGIFCALSLPAPTSLRNPWVSAYRSLRATGYISTSTGSQRILDTGASCVAEGAKSSGGRWRRA